MSSSRIKELGLRGQPKHSRMTWRRMFLCSWGAEEIFRH
jgi:hypothetical protein